MTARTIQKVSAKFAKNDFREIKFTGNPKVNKCVTIRVHGMPSITMIKDTAHKLWVATSRGAKFEFAAPSAYNCYKQAVAGFWA